jgi:hypothetical protein
VAQINKLSVGQVLDKLRRADNVKSATEPDTKTDELDQEIRRLRAERLRIERDQKKASNASKPG